MTMHKYFVIILLAFSSSALAEAYVDSSKPFVEIEDVNDQARTWAFCAAAYDIMSTIMQQRSPERAMQLGALGNGAKVAAGMTLIVDELDPDITPERFRQLWQISSEAMMQWPQQQLDAILADGERLGSAREEEFGRKINATVVSCIGNLKDQKAYVDSWQELIDSGLLAPPQE